MPELKNPFLQTRYQPFFFLLLTVVLLALLALLGPQKLPVMVYKLVMPVLGGFAGCFSWLTMLPYANPSRYLEKDWRQNPEADRPDKPDFPIASGAELPFCISCVCLTVAICCGMLAVAWGL